MSKKDTVKYVAQVNQLSGRKIYININHLEKGEYELNVINKNKIVIKTNFKKK